MIGRQVREGREVNERKKRRDTNGICESEKLQLVFVFSKQTFDSSAVGAQRMNRGSDPGVRTAGQNHRQEHEFEMKVKAEAL